MPDHRYQNNLAEEIIETLVYTCQLLLIYIPMSMIIMLYRQVLRIEKRHDVTRSSTTTEASATVLYKEAYNLYMFLDFPDFQNDGELRYSQIVKKC